MSDDTVQDEASIKRVAKTADERREALNWCLTKRWSSEDIAKLERTDTDQWHGWEMSRKK